MTKPQLHPGNRPDVSGQYEEVGPRGGLTGNEVTAVAGKPLPPTSKPGNGYILADATKHKG
jgi:hypothetical protein